MKFFHLPRPRLPRFTSARLIVWVFSWSRALVPIIAALAAFASAVRTYQTTQEIYKSAGSSDWIVFFVSLAFTVAVEGAIFVLALAQEGQRIEWRKSKRKRNVVTVLTVKRAIEVRLGKAEPLTYDQMPEGNLLSLVIWIAFGYALISNYNMGLRPLIDQTQSQTLQAFLAGLPTATAKIQSDFIVDSASVLFPPFMALIAGRLTATFGSRMVGSITRADAVQKGSKMNKPERVQPVQPERSTEPKLNASERLRQYLNANPEAIDLTQRELAKAAEVSVGTVNAYFKAPAQPNVVPNGHLPEEDQNASH